MSIGLEVRRVSAVSALGEVVDDASFSAATGSITLVAGSEGSGVGPLLAVVAGVLASTEGDVFVRGRPRAPGDVAAVPPGRDLFQSLTVLENLRVVARARELTARETSAAVERLWHRLPLLAGWRDRMVGTLSGGQQQLVALGRAMLGEPSVMVLDQATTGLSPATWADVCTVLGDLRDAGAVVLVADQRVRLVLPLADRCVVLDDGRVVASGPVAELAELAIEMSMGRRR